MKNIYIVYETDQWHSTGSREIAMLTANRQNAVNSILKKFAPAEVKNVQKHLDTINQTQGYETNFEIEETTLDEWTLSGGNLIYGI